MALDYYFRCPVHNKYGVAKPFKLKVGGHDYMGVVRYCMECHLYYYAAIDMDQIYLNSTGTIRGKRVQIVSYENVESMEHTINSGETSQRIESLNKKAKKKAKKARQKAREEAKKENIKVSEKKGKKNKDKIKNNGANNKIKIHLYTKYDDSRINPVYQNFIRQNYSSFNQGLEFNAFIKKVFPEGFEQEAVIRNKTYRQETKDDSFIVRRIELFNNESSYLRSRLKESEVLVVAGNIKHGELYIDDLSIVNNRIIKENDIKQKFNFVYHNISKKENCLNELITDVANTETNENKEIKLWEDYLDWKDQLIKLRISGLKYLGIDFNLEDREMYILTVANGEEEFKPFLRYLKKNNVSLYPNSYSKDRWIFNMDKKGNDSPILEDSVPLTFIDSEQLQVDDIQNEEWDIYRDSFKKYKDDRNNGYDINSLIEKVYDEYRSPVFYMLTFEFTEYANDTIRYYVKKNTYITDEISYTLAGEFYGDGFLASNEIGSFCLLQRLKKAVSDFKAGNCVSGSLERWLFDITKAQLPDHIEKVTHWQNKNLNESQKEAVEKMLSVPDVGLIQGPPGTGKTTVIAELIYQLAIRKNRIMITSQSNLAVDNALSRLLSNPQIRAVRLGNRKKINEGVDDITEDNVIETFNKSLIHFIDDEYLKPWKSHDDEIKRNNDSLDQYGEIDEKIARLNKQIESEEELIESHLLEIKELQRSLDEITIDHEDVYSYFCSNGQSFIKKLSDDDCKNICQRIKPELTSLEEQGIRVIDLDHVQEIIEQKTNIKETINLVLMHVRTLLQLPDRLNNTISENDAHKISNLKEQEQILMMEAMNSDDPKIFMKWKQMKKELQNLMDQSGMLSQSEKEMFFKINANDNDLVKGVLSAVADNLSKIFDNIEKYIDEKIEENKYLKEQIKNDKDNISSSKSKISSYKQEIHVLKQNKHSHEDDLKEIGEKNEIIRQKDNDRINRSIWEPIFIDFIKWVDQIPDYSQERDEYLKNYINGCNVVGVSCTENSRTLTDNGFDSFDVVIIDEVSKATPPELLIPMLKGKKIILVGDHRQLPPLFNEHEKSYEEVLMEQDEDQDVILKKEDFMKYKDLVTASLFEKYFENADDSIKQTLKYQYRMHQDIMDVINMFYNGQLIDGNDTISNPDIKDHHLSLPSIYGSKMITPDKHAYWFDSSSIDDFEVYEQRKDGSTSAQNILEAYIIINLLKSMEIKYKNMNRNEKVEIGVISFYYDQVVLIKQLLKDETFYAIDVEVNTVDKFQGKEKEVIFVSLVRNRPFNTLSTNSHIASYQRINVAFSRAEDLLIIVGAKDMYANQPVKIKDLEGNEDETRYVYREIIEMLNHRAAYFTSDEVVSRTQANQIINSIRGEK